MAERADILEHSDALKLTSNIVSSYVANHSIDKSQLPDVIKSVYDSLSRLNGGDSSADGTNQKPAVPIEKSVTRDYIVCLEDGKKFKLLRSHLRIVYGLSPNEYRAKWGLPGNYPMVAKNYGIQRSALAKKSGLGNKRRSTP